MKEFYAIKSQGKRTLFTFLIFLSLVSLNTKSQVTYISATGDGGFETGTSFASNGWSVANHNSGNRSWYVGTGQTGYTGNRCAFIGNSSTSVGTTNSARTVHLYRSITIPLGATNIQLTFKYKQATSDFISPTYYDYIAVYTDTNTPTEGNLPGGTLQFGPYPNTSVSTFTTQNVTLPNSLAGTTTNLIFTFKADIDSPHAYGAVDDVSLTYTAPPACTTPTAQPTLLSLTPGSTTVTGSFTAASPAPSNYLVVRNTSGVAPSPVNTNSYTIGSTTLGGTNVVVDNDTNTSFSDTGLTVNTTYYYFVYAFNNNACSGGPTYLSTTPLNGNTQTVPSYCTPTTTSNSRYINALQSMGTLNDVLSASAPGYSTSGYGNYTATTIAEQVPDGPVNIYVALIGSQYLKAYVDWNKDGDFDDANETVYSSGNTTFALDTTIGFIVPTGQTAGNYRIRFHSRGSGVSGEDSTFNACSNSTRGEVEDYILKVTADCSAKIATITNGTACGPTSSVTLTATGTAGTTGFYWYTSATGGTGTFTATGSWNTPVLSVGTTKYYVTAYNGSCESKFRTEIKATVKTVPSLTFSNPTPTVCGQDDIISISASGTSEEIELLNESFESGLGLFTSTIPTATGAGTDSQWAVHTSSYQPANTVVWKPAISSGLIGDKFALAASDYSGSNIVTNLTQTGSINTVGFTSLNIDFKHYYSFYSGDSGDLQVSTDGGTTWITPAGGSTTSDIGTPAAFVDKTVDLSSYINQANLKIRFRYTAQFADGWALDDVRVYGNKPLSPNFTWSGGVDAYTDAACTNAYTAGTTASTVYIKPTLTQLTANTYNIVANANLSNSCTTSGTITVTNNSRVWTGGYGNDWNTEDNWSPNNGVPDANSCVIIPNGAISQITNAPTAYAKNVDVQTGGNLEIQANQNLIITDWLKTNGTLNVRNGANLVQLNDSPTPANSGTGTFNMDRTATNLKAFDYIYWSSPVANFPVTSVSPLSQTTRIYQWIPDVNNGVGTPPSYGYGNWSNTTENMVAGKGYIIRVPNSNTSFSTTFTGIPKNGIITRTITRGSFTGTSYTGANGLLITNTTDNMNLVGNPYPSAIDAVEFLTTNSGVIDGKVYLWTHNTPISTSNQSPYYQSYAYNYSSSNYVTYNKLGSNEGPFYGFNGKIGAGQGFFVEMLDGAAGTNTITFNNSMRTDNANKTYDNSQFYKTSKIEPEKHRIWLDFFDNNSNMTRFMIGYATDATNGRDRLFDASTNYQDPFTAFSILDDEIFSIQGKAVPFDNNDKVNIGFQVPAQGNYKFAIAYTDGLFADKTQKVYLEDLLTGTIHDLTLSPYSFTSEKGLYKNRFVLKYNKENLATNNPKYDNSITVFGTEYITIKSELFFIKDIQIYDVLGKSLFTSKDLNKKESTFNLRNTNSALLVKITLENGAIVTKKIIY